MRTDSARSIAPSLRHRLIHSELEQQIRKIEAFQEEVGRLAEIAKKRLDEYDISIKEAEKAENSEQIELRSVYLIYIQRLISSQSSKTLDSLTLLKGEQETFKIALNLIRHSINALRQCGAKHTPGKILLLSNIKNFFKMVQERWESDSYKNAFGKGMNELQRKDVKL